MSAPTIRAVGSALAVFLLLSGCRPNCRMPELKPTETGHPELVAKEVLRSRLAGRASRRPATTGAMRPAGGMIRAKMIAPPGVGMVSSP